MGMLTSIPVDEIRRRGNIRDSDVVRMRAVYDASDSVSVADIETLFALHAATPIQDPTWTDFFVAAITEYIVHQALPDGYVVAENARWLIDHVTTFGRIETSTEMTLLVRVLETARWTPPTLAAFALDQIRHAVETGSGPLRAARDVPAGTITSDEVDLAGRCLCALGGGTNMPATRVEADALFAINRAIVAGGSPLAWTALFVRVIGSSVLASMGHAVPSRREQLDSIASADVMPEFMTLFLGPRDSLGQSPHASVAKAPAACRVWRSAPVLSAEERALVRLERQRLEIVTNEVIEETTDLWLMDRLSEKLEQDASETALLAYVSREASNLSAELSQFAAKRAIAA